MQVLALELRVQNRTLRQVKRDGSIAIYELRNSGGLLLGYEVVVIRIRKAHEAFGKQFPDMERYPINEEWGTYGWSYQALDLAGAQKRFDSLLTKWGVNLIRQPMQTDLVAK
jgi:hypothetical protein